MAHGPLGLSFPSLRMKDLSDFLTSEHKTEGLAVI